MKNAYTIWPGTVSSSDEQTKHLNNATRLIKEGEIYFSLAEPRPQIHHIIYDAAESNYEKGYSEVTNGRFIVVLEGQYKSIVSIDGIIKEVNLNAGDILFSERNGWSKAFYDKEDYSAIAVIFYEEYIRLVYSVVVNKKILKNTYYHTPEAASPITSQILNGLNALCKSTSVHRFSQGKSIMQALILAVVDDVQEKRKDELGKSEQLIKEVISYMNVFFRRPVNCTSISNHFKLNRSYLSHMFKKITGENMKDHLLQLRIERSKYLLLNYDLKITTISLQCGFLSTSYFIKKFKKIHGTSPNIYRQQQKKTE